MADKRVKIVDIQINAVQAIETLGEYGITIDNAKARMKVLRKEFKDGKIDIVPYKQEMAICGETIKEAQAATYRLSQQLQNQGNALKAQEGSIRQLKTELRAATLAYENMSRAERESATGTSLKAHISQIKSELTSANLEATNMYRNMGDTSKVESGLSSISKKLKDFATQMAAIATGGSIVRLGQSAIDLGRKFYDGMAQVKAVTQATDGEMTKLTDTARELGRTTKFHATDAAKAMENLSRGGFNTNEVLTSINTTLEMAQANAIDLDTSSDVLIRALRGFKMPINEENVTRVSDVLSQAARKSATNVTEMAQAFKNAAPFAGALNIPIEQVSAALGVLADSGTRGADAGTAMRMALLGLANPTSKAGKVFKEYGITIDQVELKTKGLAGVFDELENSGIFKDQNSMAKLSTIFGRRTVSNVINLIGNLDRYKQKLYEVENAQGTTAQMFKQSLDPASNALYTLSSAWEDFKIGLYNFNSDKIKGFAETLTSLVQFITTNLPTIASVVTNLIASFALTKVAGSVIESVNQISSTIVTKAQQASDAVTASQQKEMLLRKQVATLTAEQEQIKTGAVQASAEREQVVDSQLATKKQQLAIQTATTQKAKAAEVAAWNNAQAMTAGNAWARGMAIAKVAFVSFAATAKAAIKSFGIMLAISLAIEGLTKLYDVVKGMFTNTDKLAEQHKALMNSINSQRQQIDKSGADAAVKEANRLNMLRAAAANANRPLNERNQAIKALMSIAKPYQASISKSGVLIEKNTDAIQRQINKMKDLAKAQAAMSIYQKNAEKLLQLDMQDADSDQKIKNVNNAINKRRESGQAKAKAGQASYTTKDSKGNTEVISSDEYVKRETDRNLIEMLNGRKKRNEQAKKAILKQQAYLEKTYNAGTNAASEEVKKTKDDTSNTVTREPSDVDAKEAAKAAKARAAAAAKAARLAETEASKEQKAIKALHDAMEATMEDTIEKRRTQIETQYNDEINKLKSRLATERNLTAKAKDAINETIKYKEIKKNQELEKLSDENIKQEVARQQKYIASRLSVVQKGSKEELELKKQKIDEETKLSLVNLNSETKTGTRDATEKRDNAKNDMDAAKAKLDSDTANGADAETLAKDQENYNATIAAYQAMQQALTNITAQYEQERLDIETNARRQKAQADLEYAQQQEADRQQVFTNRLAELQIEGEEQTKLQQDLNTLGLDVQTQNEQDQLEVQRQAAQDKLDFAQQFQQQQDESDEEYTQRLADLGMTRLEADTQYTEAKKNLASVNAQINQGEIKNEEAKKKAFQSVGNSLVSMLDTLGESNTEFAKLSKIITLAQIAIDTGRALSAGIASASSLPYPANIAAIASTIASVLASVATAISTVKSAKFAEGGKVTGPGTGTSDSIPAQLSNGEYVMTARATRMFEPLLAAMNGIGAGVPIASNRNYSVIQNTNDMTDSFSQAAQEIRPVVSVVEISDAQKRVETIQNIDNV